MIKNIFIFLILFNLSSCESLLQKEAKKTFKAKSSQDRINSGAANNEKILEELK